MALRLASDPGGSKRLEFATPAFMKSLPFWMYSFLQAGLLSGMGC